MSHVIQHNGEHNIVDIFAIKKLRQISITIIFIRMHHFCLKKKIFFCRIPFQFISDHQRLIGNFRGSSGSVTDSSSWCSREGLRFKPALSHLRGWVNRHEKWSCSCRYTGGSVSRHGLADELGYQFIDMPTSAWLAVTGVRSVTPEKYCLKN